MVGWQGGQQRSQAGHAAWRHGGHPTPLGWCIAAQCTRLRTCTIAHSSAGAGRDWGANTYPTKQPAELHQGHAHLCKRVHFSGCVTAQRDQLVSKEGGCLVPARRTGQAVTQQSPAPRAAQANEGQLA